MKKIGIALFTLLALTTSACAESPTASAAGAEASLSGGVIDSGYIEEENPGFPGTGNGVGTSEEDAMTTTLAERNPGLGLTGH